jgi:NAD-dependent SIR2 family protein deacetylase
MDGSLLSSMEVMSNRDVVFQLYHRGADPREVLAELLGPEASTYPEPLPTEPVDLWELALRLATHADKPPVRDITDIYTLLHCATRIVVLIGAGASSGPDFRSPGGLSDTIAHSGLLEDPYDVFNLNCFFEDPSIFWRFAHLIFPAEEPEFSATHFFLEHLEAQGKILRVYSQNVDTLERGISDDHLRCVHGSWRENQCLHCHQVYSMEDLRPAVAGGVVPQCVNCGGPIKPGIVFFGQPTNLDEDEVQRDAAEADLLLVIGTSLRVKPISELPSIMRNVPSVLINREPVDCLFNGELLGDCTDIIRHLEMALGWIDPEPAVEPLRWDINKFVFPSESDLATSVWETGRDAFLVTAERENPRDLE